MIVIPVKTGIQNFIFRIDSRLHGNDKIKTVITLN